MEFEFEIVPHNGNFALVRGSSRSARFAIQRDNEADDLQSSGLILFVADTEDAVRAHFIKNKRSYLS